MYTKRTKIVCTIGPASEDVKTLTKFVENGMNVARLNFSHGSYDNHAMIIKNLRTVSKKTSRPIAILQDLQGPKIRVSKLEEPVPITAGKTITIGKEFGIDFDFSKFVKPGHRILIEDGILELHVKKVVGTNIVCVVKTTGVIKSNKGINLPDTRITDRVMPEKDIKDLKFGLTQGLDFVALSFVRNAKDITHLRGLIKKNLPKGFIEPQIIAKIELPEAVEKFDEILAATDAVMVARGDLGVEVEESKVPIIQKMIIEKCRQSAKPVIVATQMLDSMIRNPRPTRAEVTDVAGAVMDKADAVMLSGESAFGSYPVEAVSQMNRIIIDTEESEYVTAESCDYLGDKESTEVAQLCDSVAYLAESSHAEAIIAGTESGFTARFLSQPRPHVPIVMLTKDETVVRQMNLLWGVTPVLVNTFDRVLGFLEEAVTVAKKLNIVKKGDKAVLVTGNPIGRRVNLIEAVTVK
jgi:pyruvate kinase